MKMEKLYNLFLFFCLLAFVTPSAAQAYLSVQGTVQKSTGASVDDGDYSLTFKLYTTETGGTPVWSETQGTVNIIGGVYSVTLGSENPLVAAFDQPYYLGVTVGTGTELTPRARLTSSPYALSLIGQDNIFPSTGAVGAGTAAPTAGYQLHVKAATGNGKLLVEGENNAQIDLKQGTNTASIAYDGSAVGVPGTVNMPGTLNAGTINVTNFNPTNFSPSNLAVTSKLAVGQSNVDANFLLKAAGNTQITGYLEVTGTTTAGTNVYKGLYCDYGHCGTNSVSTPVSIKAGAIFSNGGVWVTSDKRIKKDLLLSDNKVDLANLQKLRVTDYRHVDEVATGTAFKKGFIAQEVEQILPEAITLSNDFVPNVYAVSERVYLRNGLLHVELGKNHGFVPGDEVKMVMPDDSEQKLVVCAVLSEKAFSVKWAEGAPEEVFVYGKKVKDFHTVDYDRIFTLNVSATQELARRVEQLEAENAALRQRNDGLQQQNEGLRSDVSDIYKRLQSLEKRSHLEK